MRKLTDCLKINKQIDKSNNSQIIGEILSQIIGSFQENHRKTKEITSNTSIGWKRTNKIIKIVITHLEMESETLQPLPAKDFRKTNSCLSVQRLDSD